jgi:hypothetical protein
MQNKCVKQVRKVLTSQETYLTLIAGFDGGGFSLFWG